MYSNSFSDSNRKSFWGIRRINCLHERSDAFIDVNRRIIWFNFVLHVIFICLSVTKVFSFILFICSACFSVNRQGSEYSLKRIYLAANETNQNTNSQQKKNPSCKIIVALQSRSKHLENQSANTNNKNTKY